MQVKVAWRALCGNREGVALSTRGFQRIDGNVESSGIAPKQIVCSASDPLSYSAINCRQRHAIRSGTHAACLGRRFIRRDQSIVDVDVDQAQARACELLRLTSLSRFEGMPGWPPRIWTAYVWTQPGVIDDRDRHRIIASALVLGDLHAPHCVSEVRAAPGDRVWRPCRSS